MDFKGIGVVVYRTVFPFLSIVSDIKVSLIRIETVRTMQGSAKDSVILVPLSPVTIPLQEAEGISIEGIKGPPITVINCLIYGIGSEVVISNIGDSLETFPSLKVPILVVLRRVDGLL